MELNTIENNVPKIRAILSSVENSDIPLREHLHNRQVKQDTLSAHKSVQDSFRLESRGKNKMKIHLLRIKELDL